MLSARVPDLTSLELLLVVARTGSLNTAAAEIGVSQQAASARMTAIEAQTGVVLMTRSPRGSALTPAGVVAAEWAVKVLDAAAELDAGLSALRQDRATTLRVSASLTIAEQLLPGWLVALNAAAAANGQPGATIVLRATNSDTVAADVRGGAADVGFVEGPLAPKGLRSRSVARDRLVVVVRPDHAWGRRRLPLSPAELARTPLVTREEGSGTRNAFETALRAVLGADESEAISAPVLALSTSAAVRAAVLAGAGPAVLSELAVADDLSAQRLRAVPVSGLSFERTLRAVWVGAATPPAGPVRDLISLAGRAQSRRSASAQPADEGNGHAAGPGNRRRAG